MGNLCCAREYSVQFFVQFLIQLNFTVELRVYGALWEIKRDKSLWTFFSQKYNALLFSLSMNKRIAVQNAAGPTIWGADLFRLLDYILITEPDSLCHCFKANSTTPRWQLSVIIFHKCRYLKYSITKFTALITSVCSLQPLLLLCVVYSPYYICV
jgi:hypothetical protein